MTAQQKTIDKPVAAPDRLVADSRQACDVVRRAIAFEQPERIPLYLFNRSPEKSDIVACPLSLHQEEGAEWSVCLQNLGDGTMGHPDAPALPTWADFAAWQTPALQAEQRRRKIERWRRQTEPEQYYLAWLGLTGFTVYTLLRGFENSMVDFLTEPEQAGLLLERIMDFECTLAALAAAEGFHGIHFADDWGTQTDLMVSPVLWREFFKQRYARQFQYMHELGLQIWFHSCGNIAAIAPDLHEIGVDVLNISQPNVVDIPALGKALRGKQCFMVPISYQTVSISGTPDDIHREAELLREHLASPDGGFIGYVENYACMGMSEMNYQACIDAFAAL